MHADRAINVKLSEFHAADLTELDGHGQLLKLQVTVDGMDQTKFNWPRNDNLVPAQKKKLC